MSDLLFKSTLTPEKIEHAYSMGLKARDAGRQGFADTGYRAALARDPRMLIALEAMAETTGRMQEAQMGQTMRSSSATFGESKGTTEHQLCREAFRLCDEGKPIRNFEWLYGMAAFLCGFNL